MKGIWTLTLIALLTTTLAGCIVAPYPYYDRHYDREYRYRPYPYYGYYPGNYYQHRYSPRYYPYHGD